MSAPVGTVVEDSSSEDEDLEKFKEAAWSFGTYGTNGTNTADGESNGKLSRRVAVSKHEHDGNELQTTPEFRAHVAKKLGAILDSCISLISAETSKPCTASTKCEDEEGFRLFTTSVPGEFTIDPPPPPVRRRPIPSSSDSDSELEMRLREAAVSVTDLLSSALPSAVTPSMPESLSSEKIKKKKKKKKYKVQAGEEAEREHSNNSPVPKKNKKRTASHGEFGEVENCGEASPYAKTEEEQKSPEEDSLPLKVKKKNKKAQMKGWK
ncbi:protein CUSTOS [Coregonus clupeaformis]|uniref:protein CUSTOS n=1 Tax=Coregonus clupeaformis TaxID=59861 RepID=UPI001BE02E97|nr:protein CUSTOS [Coregonus clupeaformis]